MPKITPSHLPQIDKTDPRYFPSFMCPYKTWRCVLKHAREDGEIALAAWIESRIDPDPNVKDAEFEEITLNWEMTAVLENYFAYLPEEELWLESF